MNQAARAALRLLAVLWLVLGFSRCGGSAVHFLKFSELYQEPGWFNSWLAHLGAATFAFLLSSIIPAAVLLLGSSWLSDRLFPAETSSNVVGPSAAYSIGAILLGIFFMVQGAAGTIGGAASTVAAFSGTSEVVRPTLVSSASEALLYGLVQLGLGCLVYRHGAEMARRLTSRCS